MPNTCQNRAKKCQTLPFLTLLGCVPWALRPSDRALFRRNFGNETLLSEFLQHYFCLPRAPEVALKLSGNLSSAGFFLVLYELQNLALDRVQLLRVRAGVVAHVLTKPPSHHRYC